MTKPAKFEHHTRLTPLKHDAVMVTQTDTGAAEVIRQVVVLGDSTTGETISKSDFVEQTITLKAILCELQKLNEQMEQVTGLNL